MGQPAGSGKESLSTLTGAQSNMLRQIFNQIIGPQVGSGATPFGYDTTVPMPEGFNAPPTGSSGVTLDKYLAAKKAFDDQTALTQKQPSQVNKAALAEAKTVWDNAQKDPNAASYSNYLTAKANYDKALTNPNNQGKAPAAVEKAWADAQQSTSSIAAQASQPDLYNQFISQISSPENTSYLTDNLKNVINGIGSYQGGSVYQPNVNGVVSDFQTNVLTPVTNTLMQTLGMDTYRAQNQAGRFFGSDVKANVGKAVGQQLGLTTAPLLNSNIQDELNKGFTSSQQNTQNIFASRENLAGQKLQALSGLQQLPTTQFSNAIGAASAYQQLQQQYLSGQAGQTARSMPENDPWLQLAHQFISTQAIAPVQQQGTDMTGQMMGMGLAGLMFGGGMFGGAPAASSGGSTSMMAPTTFQQSGNFGGYYSDRRLKENIEPIESALDKVSQLTGYTYNLKTDSPANRTGGVMAQDLEKILPDAVIEINGIKMVKYEAVIGLLVEAVKELTKRTN